MNVLESQRMKIMNVNIDFFQIQFNNDFKAKVPFL
jgi:hypothetical protein